MVAKELLVHTGKKFLDEATPKLLSSIYLYLPSSLQKNVLLKKLDLKTNESVIELFTEHLNGLKLVIHKHYENLANQEIELDFDSMEYQTVDLLKKQMNFVETLRLSYSLALQQESDYKDSSTTQNSEYSVEEENSEYTVQNYSPTWFSLFKEIAERDSEPFRQLLIARAAAYEFQNPGSISLKTLWNIGLIDEQLFDYFNLFLESSLYFNGQAAIIFDKSKHGSEFFDVQGGRVSLAVVLSSLIEHGLISYDMFQMDSFKPISINSLTYHAKMNYSPIVGEDEEDSYILPYIQLEGYHCTDLGVDIFRFCDIPPLNSISDKNYIELKNQVMGSEEITLVLQGQ